MKMKDIIIFLTGNPKHIQAENVKKLKLLYFVICLPYPVTMLFSKSLKWQAKHNNCIPEHFENIFALVFAWTWFFCTNIMHRYKSNKDKGKSAAEMTDWNGSYLR